MACLLLAAVLAAVAGAPTQEAAFEAAFQGQCGEESPCEQLCRELHDGTYECGCGPGYQLNVDGYGCTAELNATKATPPTLFLEENIIYQKDVSFSAELEVAPSTRIKPTVSEIRTTEEFEHDNRIDDEPDFQYTGERKKKADGLRSLIEDGVSTNELNIIIDYKDKRNYFPRANEITESNVKVPTSTVPPPLPPWRGSQQSCSCTSERGCSCYLLKDKADYNVTTPRFGASAWLALPALRGAYKRVRLHIRVRPERSRGVLLLTGEHDDLSGDYLALVLLKGHVELRFDCGSGAGILRSPETLRMGQWNNIYVYRHRWDAWLKLNNGPKVRGRSKGLFSRMTFREPVWVGGPGNTTGLDEKLGETAGIIGCVDFLRINGETYNLVKDATDSSRVEECAPTHLEPTNIITTKATIHQNEEKHDIYNINDLVDFEDTGIVMRDPDSKYKLTQDIYNDKKEPYNTRVIYNDKKETYNTRVIYNNKKDLITHDIYNDKKEPLSNDIGLGQDKDVKDIEERIKDCNCQHGGGCVRNMCLCPLGYAGERCEITLDLKVPRFNGSSYLRLPGLGSSAIDLLDIQITLKPSSGNGLLLYNSEDDSYGVFISLHLRDYYIEFAFDLGSGIALVRSPYPLTPNTWHQVSISRSGRHASLRVHGQDGARSVSSLGKVRWLIVNQPMLLGGAPWPLPPRLALKSGFSGCVGKLVINNEELSVVASALGGVNVDNCEDTQDNSCRDTLCKESIAPIPQYPQELSINDTRHTIVPKKGIKIKPHKKLRKHLQHNQKNKKKKYYPTKKELNYQNSLQMTHDVMNEEPYDGKTYMQMKYLTANDVDWIDTNTYPSFSGQDSFIHIDDEETMDRLVSYTLDINIRFRSEKSDGLLVWSGRPGSAKTDFLSLAIENSVLVFRYDLGSGEVVIIANHTKIDDGLWHRARATRNRQAGVLEVDGLGSIGKVSPGKLKQLNTDNGLYIGGLPSIEINTMGKYKSGLVGCVSQISLSGDFDIPLSFSKLPHTITNNVGKCAP